METLFKNKTKTTMKTEKLTIKDCMLYPNARINIKMSKSPKTSYSVIEFLDPVNLDYVNLFGGDPTCKLQLRPIESLTEEERLKVGQIIVSDKGEFLHLDTMLVQMKQVKIADYLRSINIDIDGFIASGKAVEE